MAESDKAGNLRDNEVKIEIEETYGLLGAISSKFPLGFLIIGIWEG